MTKWLCFTLGVALAGAACQSPPTPPPTPEVAWRSLGSWSGRGNVQTESFTSDSGSMKVEWKAKDAAKPGAGTFHLTIHSAISGRPLMEAVNQQGVGAGTAFVHEDPRVFYAVVESADLDWSFSLQEAVLVERRADTNVRTDTPK